MEETIKILQGIKSRYEDHHKLTISDEAIHAATTLAAKYILDRHLPDKAIDLIDEAASGVRIRDFNISPKFNMSPKFKEMQQMLDSLQQEQEAAIVGNSTDKAKDLRLRMLNLNEKLSTIQSQWEQEHKAKEKPVVTENDVAEVVCIWTDIPISTYSQLMDAAK